jgi:hypothetical protein
LRGRKPAFFRDLLMEQERIQLRVTAINLDSHASQTAILRMLARHLEVPLADLREEFTEIKDKEMERLLIQLENADPAFAAELSAIEERSPIDGHQAGH